MKLLVIGGTRFVGRAIVEFALSRGHEITLFNRGKSGADAFDVETIVGDRDGETDKLAGRKWDAVIDTCGYVPRVVEQSAFVLDDAVDLYCFISTISVYDEGQQPPLDENAELRRFEEAPKSEEITAETYGAFKVLCEEAVNRIMGGDKTLIVRPGLIVGPNDTTDRFTYWIDRYSSRGPILLPSRASQPIQFIDVRDLAEFTVRMVEDKSTGIFNVTGPAHDTFMGEVWGVMKQSAGGLPEEVLVTDDFLAQNDVQEWKDLPFVTQLGEDLTIVDISKAISCGLTIRPMAQTVQDTAEWHRTRGENVELKAGMSREREQELLAKWAETSNQ